MPSYTPKKLNAVNRVSNVGAGSCLYQVPTNTTTVLKTLTVSNTTGSSATINVYFASVGSSTQASFGFLNNLVLRGYETLLFQEPGILNSEFSIWAGQSTAGAINLMVSGIEVLP